MPQSALRVQLQSNGCEVVEQEVRKAQRQREHERDGDRLLVGEGIARDGVEDPRQDARVLERVPAVQAQDAAEVDPERPRPIAKNAKIQPATAPRHWRTAVCIRYSEAKPRSTPIHANAAIVTASYQ